MLALLLLAAAPAAQSVAEGPPLCVPVPSDRLKPTPSEIEKHRALRRAMDEPMPDASVMVMLHGEGGHLATEEYSIIVARSADGLWRGTAVGRSRIWVKDAPYTPMKRAEWILDKATSQKLDSAIDRTCPFDRSAPDPARSGPPPLGYVSEMIDIVEAGQVRHSFYAEAGGAGIAALIRPPR